MSDPHPRYVVREITGYPEGVGSARPATSIRIADTWYLWRSVQEYSSVRFSGQNTYSTNRIRANTLCAELNAEHDAWLAAG